MEILFTTFQQCTDTPTILALFVSIVSQAACFHLQSFFYKVKREKNLWEG